MIEAVGWQHIGTFFDRCSELLHSHGAMLLQAITIDDRAYEVEKASKSFIKEYIFPGGCLPSMEVIMRNVARHTDLQAVGLKDITASYVETLRRWRENIALPPLGARAARLRRALSSAVDAVSRPTARAGSPSGGSAMCNCCWPSRSGRRRWARQVRSATARPRAHTQGQGFFTVGLIRVGAIAPNTRVSDLGRGAQTRPASPCRGRPTSCSERNAITYGSDRPAIRSTPTARSPRPTPPPAEAIDSGRHPHQLPAQGRAGRRCRDVRRRDSRRTAAGQRAGRVAQGPSARELRQGRHRHPQLRADARVPRVVVLQRRGEEQRRPGRQAAHGVPEDDRRRDENAHVACAEEGARQQGRVK